MNKAILLLLLVFSCTSCGAASSNSDSFWDDGLEDIEPVGEKSISLTDFDLSNLSNIDIVNTSKDSTGDNASGYYLIQPVLSPSPSYFANLMYVSSNTDVVTCYVQNDYYQSCVLHFVGTGSSTITISDGDLVCEVPVLVTNANGYIFNTTSISCISTVSVSFNREFDYVIEHDSSYQVVEDSLYVSYLSDFITLDSYSDVDGVLTLHFVSGQYAVGESAPTSLSITGNLEGVDDPIYRSVFSKTISLNINDFGPSPSFITSLSLKLEKRKDQEDVDLLVGYYNDPYYVSYSEMVTSLVVDGITNPNGDYFWKDMDGNWHSSDDLADQTSGINFEGTSLGFGSVNFLYGEGGSLYLHIDTVSMYKNTDLVGTTLLLPIRFVMEHPTYSGSYAYRYNLSIDLVS